MDYHPWRALRHLGDSVRLIWTPLEPGTFALTDGQRRIWMSPDQYQVQRRCTIAHEVAHVELGHTEGCTSYDERAATELAARRLIPMERLLDGLRWTQEWEELADELWVDVDTLMARLDTLTDFERGQIAALSLLMERGC